MTEVCVRWVSRMFDQKMKDYRCKASCGNLKLTQLEWNLFVRCVATDNETWIHRYNHETKQQSMQWKYASTPSPRKFKVQASARKIMSTVFWDAEGDCYGDADLLSKQHVASKEKRRGMLTYAYTFAPCTLQLLTGHNVDKLLYLKNESSVIFTKRHLVIAVCFEI